MRVIKGIKKPYGTTVNSKGQIIVAELKGNCVSILTAEGEKVRSICADATGKALNYPTGIAVDNDDNIYVVDNNNHRIVKFSSDGKFIAAVGTKGSNHLQFQNPFGICFNKRNNMLYIADQYNHRVQVLFTDLKFVKSFGSNGTEMGQFDYPKCVASDNANNLYVTDRNNHRVQSSLLMDNS